MSKKGKGGRKPKDPSKQIYNNAQELTSMIFGYDLSTDDGKTAVDNLLSSYQTQSGGGYVIEKGVAVKKDPKSTFDSDKFFTDMDTMLGFNEGELEGVSTASLEIEKNQALINEQINKNVNKTNGNVTGFNVKYDNKGNLIRTDLQGAIDYQNDVYKQHRTDIKEAGLEPRKFSSKEMEEKYKKYKEKKEKIIQKQFDSRPNGPGTKADKKSSLINRLIYSPSDILDKDVYSGSDARKMLDKAFTEDRISFTKHASEQVLDDVDFLFREDASDKVLNAAYKNVNNKTWQDDFIRNKYNNGGYSQFDFGAKKYEDLKGNQIALLREDFEANELKKFKEGWENIGQTSTQVKKGPFRKPESYTADVPYNKWSPQIARQSFMTREYFNGLNPNTKEFTNAFNSVLEKTESEKQKKALEAYQKYAKRQFNKGTTTRIKDAATYMKDFLPEKEAEKAASVLRKEMSGIMDGLGHDGIKAASKLKGLKVAAGIIGGTTALWGLSEIYDE
jgi:hypothetical protein